jgi:GT2 family glycosyltransferase
MTIPNSLSAMAAQTRPIRIVTVNIEQPLPDICDDDRYSEAWVVLCRRGLPRATAVVDLTTGEAAIRDRLQDLLAQLEVSVPNEPDRTVLADSCLPRISVVVPSILARTQDVGRCIEEIGRLDYPDFEVLLIDNRRVLPTLDPLPELVRNRPWLRVIRESRPGISAARNAGVAQATGEVVAFTDDDVRVDGQWLRAIGTRLALNPQIDAVSGLILPAELESPAQVWFERFYGGFGGQRTFVPVTLEIDRHGGRLSNGSRVLMRDSTGAEIGHLLIFGVGGAFVAGANMAFRKSSLARIGGFNVALGTGTRARGGEDLAAMISILWAGGKIGYEPAALVHHRHRREFSELLAQMDDYGLGYTAMLTSLVWGDPRHFLALASQFPLALKKIAAKGAERVRGKQQGEASDNGSAGPYPSILARHEHWARLRGPLAYARSRFESR